MNQVTASKPAQKHPAPKSRPPPRADRSETSNRGDLVIRLNRVISDATLEKIRAEFGSIIKSGTFELTNALPEETEEALLAGLPRLKFRFDRHGVGRLRQLIDVLNLD